MTLTVYYTSVTSSLKIRKCQESISCILTSKNIKHEMVDISQDASVRDLMREKAGNPSALPPQICNGDHYCGDYDAFQEAIEMGNLDEFLRL
ncbi:SH3 domain-binding glutamic acid-rich-like protein 3 [Synchiropus splendidus]|uniref:SH3 domain-binding glutamic acid-rich-like protein 3 n=1 Tax=Synchiropus splendidus TaxID=270530 RepID=UPI00237D861B|nr:SH3 domain-binding glutamic acid-rich-like protein 3 [Synchiropus splendidus]